MWLVHRIFLTKDQLLKRGQKSDSTYVFGGLEETIDHLFIHCSTARTLWARISHFNNFEFQDQQLEDLWFYL
jgi:zinc-binding in reverse transcriptase